MEWMVEEPRLLENQGGCLTARYMIKLGGAGDMFGDYCQLALCKWTQSLNKHQK